MEDRPPKGANLLTVAIVLIVAGALILSFGPDLRGILPRARQKLGRLQESFLDGDMIGGSDYTVCADGEERFDPDRVERLAIGWLSGGVTVEPGAVDQIVVREKADRELAEEEKLCWKLDGGTLSLRFCTARQIRISGKTLTVTVPESWVADEVEVAVTSASPTLRELHVEDTIRVGSGSGSVVLDECVCEKIEAGATSGTVRILDCVCEKIEAGATSGSVTVLDCSCDELEAGATSGSLEIRCEAEELSLRSTSGTIRCEGPSGDCELNCGSTSGPVRLKLDGRGEQRVTIDTTSGDVTLDTDAPVDLSFDTNSGEIRGDYTQERGAALRVKVDTTSGNLTFGRIR